MITPRLLASALALTVLGPGLCACTPLAARATTPPPGTYLLQGMPAGTVMVDHDTQGNLLAHVDVLGLTPGSVHDVLITGSAGPELRFSTLTADSSGRADVTLTASGGWLRPDSRLVILLGSGGGSLAGEPIAQAGPLYHEPGPFTLYPVTAGPDDSMAARPSGRATISYDAAARTLTVSVTARGLTPGAHAAHIHLGSCLNQGPVKYALADFIADGNGDVIDQTRVVTGVASVPGPGRWYLNLHQGNMNQILANGTPTMLFRPMLCADIVTFATPATDQ